MVIFLCQFKSNVYSCVMLNPFSDEYFMKQALVEAQKAFDADEVPVGAVVVCQNRIIARGYNLTETLTDVTAHAEMQAITAASQHLGSKYLKGCTLYVTLEPCVMCTGALYWSQIDKIVFGARDEKRGSSVFHREMYHPSTLVTNGVMKEECSLLLKDFFSAKRGV
jgi:tRNA(adenine34) deaminase